MALHHTGDEKCPSCDEKLDGAHPYLRDWFLNNVKPYWKDAHVSWAWRSKEDQNFFYSQGKTLLKWPASAHNCTTSDGRPNSRALDLFQITPARIAKFDKNFYVTLDAANRSKGTLVKWGGSYTHLGDFDHFQLMDTVA